MRKVLDELLEGRFNYERPMTGREDYENDVLDFSCLNLDLSIKKGESVEGSFLIIGPENGFMQGEVFSGECRMECRNCEFTGIREEIMYCFHSEGMEEGDVLKGQFCIVSNYGEYEIPYRVEIESSAVTSSLGNIKNMFHFANLAKSNWDEAVKIFYSEEFKRIFAGGNDRQYYCAYKGLSAVYGNEQNVEEFLIEINKKQKVEYLVEKEELLFEDTPGVSEHSLSVMKNGWGYTFLNVRAEGAFLKTERETVSDNEFLGNSFRLNFYIDSKKLHAGRNMGKLFLSNSYTSIEVSVVVVRYTERRRMLGIRKEKKRLQVQLMEYYLAFRMKKISTKTWMGETEKLVERMRNLDERDVPTRLFQAQLLITQERYNEAKWQLDRIRQELETEKCPPEIYCYYLYLTTLYSGEGAYVEQAAAKVAQIYRANQDNWRIAWLVLYLSEEYGKSPSKRWLMLEEQFRRGCTSPVLYVEAWHLLEINPTLLMKLNEFEIQVLNFAAERQLLQADIILQIRYLAQKKKEYSQRVFCILRACYEKLPEDETLQAICSLLMKGNKTESRYFSWYALAVERELRITRLYEYYMMALPEDYEETLPKMILMYFAYHSELDYKKNSFLYAYVCRRREEQPELYLNYCEQIERFVLEQIHKGRISEELAYLYKNTISPRMIHEETAKELAALVFMNRIRVESKEIHQIVVGYAISREELKYPVRDGVAWVPLYGNDYRLFLEDGRGNRYCTSLAYQTDRMMVPGKLLPLISPYVEGHIGIDIYMCEGDRTFINITETNVGQFRYIAGREYIEDASRSEIRLKLVHYYYEQDKMRELDEYLETLSPEYMGNKERNEILRMMVIRGMYDKAFDWIKHFGVNGVEAKTIVRLCSRLIARDGFIEDEKMTYAVYDAFCKGKYDSNLISYLAYFYTGTLHQMRDVWRAASAFEVDTYKLCERILVQMLFSGAFIGERMEIFRTYVAGGAKPQIEEAVLSQCAYDYFINDRLIDSFIFTDAVRVYERGEPLNKVCKLAMLKYYAENKSELTPRLQSVSKLFLQDMLEEKIFFPFFREYAKDIPGMQQFLDKTIVEYKTKPGQRAVIHFIIDRGSHTKNEYRKEEMRDMYGGICVKAFVLFFGEKLQYYITEESEKGELLTESVSVSKSDIQQEGTESRFNMLNDVVVAKTLQDYDTADILLEEYYRKDYVTSQIFHLR